MTFTQVQQPWSLWAPKRLYHGDLGDLFGKTSVQRFLQKILEEHRELSEKLQRSHLSESDRKELGRRHGELQPLADILQTVEEAGAELEEVSSLRNSEFICLSAPYEIVSVQYVDR